MVRGRKTNAKKPTATSSAPAVEVHVPDKPDSPAPPVSAVQVEDGVLPSSSSSDYESTQNDTVKYTPSRKRKLKEHANLSVTQEEDMFEWLKANPVIYSRGMAGYKDVQSRNKLWADKAAEMDRTVKQLKDIWYKSVRSRVGRLFKKKSGSGQFEVEACSDRDKYLCDKMAFFIPHIHEVKKRTTVSMKKKLDFLHKPTDEESVASDAGSYTSSQSKTKQKCTDDRTTEDEESVIEVVKESTTSQIQRQLLTFLNKQTETERKPRREMFVKFIRTSIDDLEDEVYLDLEFEMYQLLHRHQQRDKEMKRAKAYPGPNAASFQLGPSQTAGQYQKDAQWQPLPHQWPQQTFTNVSPWQSQDPSFVAQIHQPTCTQQYPGNNQPSQAVKPQQTSSSGPPSIPMISPLSDQNISNTSAGSFFNLSSPDTPRTLSTCGTQNTNTQQ